MGLHLEPDLVELPRDEVLVRRDSGVVDQQLDVGGDEGQGLLAAERSPSGQRRYPKEAVERVRFIQQLYAAGLSSRDIVALLSFVYTGTATADTVAKLVSGTGSTARSGSWPRPGPGSMR